MRHLRIRLMLTAAAVVIGAALSVPLASSASAQSAPAVSPKPQAAPDSPAAFPEQEIGHRSTVKADDLPPPKTGPIAASRSMTVPYIGQVPKVPDGFTATPFVTGLEHP